MPEAQPIPEAVREHLALALVPGLGPKLTAALLEKFGSASAARQATSSQLLEIPHIGEKLAGELARALRSAEIDTELQLMEKHGARAIPLGFPGYPGPLAKVPAPPPLLYCRGEWVEADANAIGIVGSRKCTPYGVKIAAQLAKGLARAGFTIVSGLARGIDGAAHRATLEVDGRTVAALAGGLSKIYPPEHTDLANEIAAGRGCLISETTMAQDPQPGMFPARNRIISGLSRAIIVIEADIRSGALITATHAAEQGREVYAVPGPVDASTSAGCLDLIRRGARLVRSADDVLEDLKGISVVDYRALGDRRQETIGSKETGDSGQETVEKKPLPAPEAPPPNLDATQQRVFDALATRRHADELCRELAMSIAELSRTLMQLELKKVVRRLPGNFYERR
jgi:DNA processing protein